MEVAVVKRGDLSDAEPLGDSDDGRVGRAEREVGVDLDKLESRGGQGADR